MRGTGWSHRLTAVVLAVLLALFVAACGGDDDEGGGTAGGDAAGSTEPDTSVSGNVSITAVWSGEEQNKFRQVLDHCEQRYPNVNIRYNSAGDQLPTVLSTAVEGGNPPDLAVVAQPGLVQGFANRNALKPLTFAEETIRANYGEDWIRAGSVDDNLYGLFFKGANKSTVWYNPRVFEDAGVEPPTTWDEFLQNAETLRASGVPAYSIAGADGWTLTDLFENIYLRTAGPELYDQLARHEIPWTHPSVIEALTQMRAVVGDRQNVAGGVNGALQTDFPSSVAQVFRDQPAAAQVIEGDFVPTALPTGANLTAGEDYNYYRFPRIGDSPEGVVMGAGDQVVMFRDTPAARATVQCLATPQAAEVWARLGGFSSPNREVDAEAYTDELTRNTAQELAQAETFRFDMSDTQPASFGATVGQGMWGILQDFLRNPNPQQTARRLEQAAARAYR
ncbi:MAG TPA: extracellular solute-binding protein [Miltoncostaeaceae bacterium]|nr:extracellular solute-binding protein [Miltoncostaeaceae bacterium]